MSGPDESAKDDEPLAGVDIPVSGEEGSKCRFWGKFEVDSSSALGQLWIPRSPLCPLLSVLAWQQLLRGLGSPQRQKQNT